MLGAVTGTERLYLRVAKRHGTDLLSRLFAGSIPAPQARRFTMLHKTFSKTECAALVWKGYRILRVDEHCWGLQWVLVRSVGAKA